MTPRTRKSRRAAAAAVDELTPADIGRFAESLGLAQRELLSAARRVREEFSLGPRGAWIIGLIATDHVQTQSDVVKRYKVGRSIIAEEMTLLTKSGLVICQQNPSDRRQVDLSLTPLGRKANEMLGDALFARMKDALGADYTAADIRFCTDLLLKLGASLGP